MPTTRRPPNLALEVARSVAATPALLPHFDDLFQGMPSLGSMPRRVVHALESAGLRPGSSVIDLACGKGTIAIALARHLRCRVLGIDACSSFIAQAKDASKIAGVARCCRWACGDLRDARASRYDAALMLGLFGYTTATPILRRLVRPGGLYVIDDALARRPIPGTPTHADARQFFTAIGDSIVFEHLIPQRDVVRSNAVLLRKLARNADRISQRHPRLARSLAAFLARQRHAHHVLSTHLRPVLWVVRKHPPLDI